MSLTLDEDQSFSLSANVLTPGPQTVVLKGYLLQQRGDGVYAASLIPQLFYGASGSQLQTWRQDLTGTGSQVILSRSGGQPKVPREDLFWRKISSTSKQISRNGVSPPTPLVLSDSAKVILVVTAVAGALIGLHLLTRKK